MSGLKGMDSESRDELLERFRNINVDYTDWFECCFSDFREDMKAKGIHVGSIYFSGFWSQGDGACFEGNLIGDGQAYLDVHHADQFPMIRKLLEADGSVTVQCVHTGRYCHEYCTEFTFDNDRFHHVMDAVDEFREATLEAWDRQLEKEMQEFEEATTEQWRVYMREIYRRLEKEHDYLTSDEAVWEAIEANDLDEAA